LHAAPNHERLHPVFSKPQLVFQFTLFLFVTLFSCLGKARIFRLSLIVIAKLRLKYSRT
jgi:hypothetical protein